MTLLHAAPLTETLSALRRGELALGRYLEQVCDRLDELDPCLHALLPEPGRRERLVQEAFDLESRFPDPDARPPLFGVPLAVKDIYRVDGFPTRAGSTLPEELFAGPEAPVATALKAAGALILGKAVTTEFAYFEPGPTRNPHNPEHTPGGSSSGSAAAVAAGYCPLALGSQTVGSVIRPAAFCGITGFKTTSGRVSLEGVVPYSPTLDHFGFFVQRPEDLRPVLSVLFPEAPACAPAAATLAVPEGPYLRQASPEMLAVFEGWLERLRAAGFPVIRVPALPDIAEINRRHQRLAAAEMAAVHREWFARYAARYRPRTAALIREGQTVAENEIESARKGTGTLRRELHDMMDQRRIDVWVSPASTGPAPAGLGSTGDPAMNLPWTHAGLPVAAVPGGRSQSGLPLGLQCAARASEDVRLAEIAAAIALALCATP